MCDGCECGGTNLQVVCKNHHVHFSFTEMIFLEIVEAAAGMDTLCCRLCEGCHLALATGKNTRLFGVLEQNETRVFTYMNKEKIRVLARN